MKIVLFGGIAAIAAGGLYMHGPRGEANVYSMPAAEVYSKLAAMKVEKGNFAPFGKLDTDVSSWDGNKVSVTASGGRAGCTATITPVTEASARVDASCEGGGEGAAAGLMITHRRNKFIELVDSTLTGRAYDTDLARGATAARWPADVIDHGTFADAVSESVEMEAETRALASEASKARVEKTRKPGDWGPEAE